VSAERLNGEPCGPGTFAVESAGQPGVWYGVEFQNAAVRWCPCNGFQQRNDCRHVREAETLWRSEHEAMLAAHRADPGRQAEATKRLKEIAEMFE